MAHQRNTVQGAIAGVINLQLKNRYKGGLCKSNPVSTKRVTVLHILSLEISVWGEKPLANLSLEYGNAGETDRSVQRDDAAALSGAGNSNVVNPAQPWGHPIIRDDIKFFANYGLNIVSNVELYGHANYAQKQVEGGFYFRNPNTRPAVFSNDGGETCLLDVCLVREKSLSSQ